MLARAWLEAHCGSEAHGKDYHPAGQFGTKGKPDASTNIASLRRGRTRYFETKLL